MVPRPSIKKESLSLGIRKRSIAAWKEFSVLLLMERARHDAQRRAVPESGGLLSIVFCSQGIEGRRGLSKF